jgi:glutathione S-transferase
MNIRMRLEGVLPLPERVQANVDRVCAIVREARTRYADASEGPFLFGSFGAVDAMYVPVMFRFLTYNIPIADAVVAEYMAAVLADEKVREWEAAALASDDVIEKYDAAALRSGGRPRAA